MEDTICAVSTALGDGAISIIRVSGLKAINIVNKIFIGQNLLKVESNTISYGKIQSKQDIIDEVLVSVFRAPKSYTCENVVEINCHGSIVSVKKILNLLLDNGCRLAEPGEFTKRAFLNDRIDLTEAEAVQSLISSKSEIANKMAFNQLSGKLSSVIKKERETLLNIMANIEVNIDYPEYEDAKIITGEIIKPEIINMLSRLKNYVKNSDTGLLINNGITIAIIGRPNVGKSSILNYLSSTEKAIVTSIPGTTRDIIESEIIIEGIKFNLIDTAGIRETSDTIETIGVKRSLETFKKADLVLFVLNYNDEITKEDIKLYNQIKKYNHLILINKNDLEKAIKNIEIFKSSIVIYGNTMVENGLDELKKEIIKMFNLGKINTKDVTYFSNVRQINLLKKAIESLNKCLKDIDNDAFVELLAVSLKEVWTYLGEIIGESYEEELLDKLFTNFCLGK